MKTNLKYIIGALFISFLGYGAWYFSTTDSKKFDASETDFAVENPEEINMIFIADRNKHANKFEKNSDGEWMINDEYKVSPDKMKDFLETLQKIVVKQPVSKTARNTVIREMATQGIKVELYTNRKLLKTYYVGGNAPDDLGTYYLMDGYEQPYIVHIRGFNGFLDIRYKIRKREWIDRTFFNCSADEIEKVKVNYFKNPEENFEITKGEIITGVDKIDSIKVKKYLNLYSNTSLESFVEVANSQQILDSLLKITPFCEVELQSTLPEKSKKIVLYGYNDDRLWGVLDKKDLVTVQHYSWDHLLVRKSYFEKQDIKL